MPIAKYVVFIPIQGGTFLFYYFDEGTIALTVDKEPQHWPSGDDKIIVKDLIKNSADFQAFCLMLARMHGLDHEVIQVSDHAMQCEFRTK
jgi:hypothetical protein